MAHGKGNELSAPLAHNIIDFCTLTNRFAKVSKHIELGMLLTGVKLFLLMSPVFN